MQNKSAVENHYGTESVRARVEQALHRANLNDVPAHWKDFAPLDQFHIRGLAATKELAEALRVEPHSRVIDVGSGLGGPSRFLAANYSCHVTGVDLSEPFVEVARALTVRCGLEELVEFHHGNALALPFEDASFDYAWTQHVAMNIADRAAMYREIARVLKAGGRFAVYDVIAGDGRALTFPVPWASTQDASFLLNEDETKRALIDASFEIETWSDKTAVSFEWFNELEATDFAPLTSSPLSLITVMGEGFLDALRNLGANLRDGRIRVAQVILKKS